MFAKRTREQHRQDAFRRLCAYDSQLRDLKVRFANSESPVVGIPLLAKATETAIQRGILLIFLDHPRAYFWASLVVAAGRPLRERRWRREIAEEMRLEGLEVADGSR